MTKSTFPRVSRRTLTTAAIATFLATTALINLAGAPSGSVAHDPARSRAAFIEVASVLRHPRCMNCHTVTDFPRQTDKRRRHIMNVQRGEDNHGAPTLRCSTCHKDENQANGVPGAPGWGLAPLSMGWENLDDHQLAEALKDTAKNGGRTLDQLFEHMTGDPLVLWAWNPGGKRTSPPLTTAEFSARLREWIDTGAFSPDPP